MKVTVDLTPPPPSAYSARLTRLEWLLESGRRREAQEGAILLLGSLRGSGNQWPRNPQQMATLARWDVLTGLTDLVEETADLFLRSEPIRTTSWERVMKEDEP